MESSGGVVKWWLRSRESRAKPVSDARRSHASKITLRRLRATLWFADAALESVNTISAGNRSLPTEPHDHAPRTPPMNGRDFLTLIENGGVVMYPLLLCSVLSIAVIIERCWTIIRAARAAERLHQLVSEADARGRPDGRAGHQPGVTRRRSVRSTKPCSVTPTTTSVSGIAQRRHAETRTAAEALHLAARHGRQLRAVHRPVRHGHRHHPRLREHGGRPAPAASPSSPPASPRR